MIFLDIIKNNLVYIMILVAVIVLILIFHKWIKLTWLLSKGKYKEAIRFCNILLKKYESKPSIGNVMLFNLSNCYFRLGAFKESSECLSRIDHFQLDESLGWTSLFLKAMNMLMLQESPSLIETKFDKVAAITKPVECYPILAYIKQKRGKTKEAATLLEDYITQTGRRSGIFDFKKKSVYIYDKFNINVENNYFIGLYYNELGNAAKAKQHFEKAAECKFDSYYKTKAKEYLG